MALVLDNNLNELRNDLPRVLSNSCSTQSRMPDNRRAKMKVVRRISINDSFETCESSPIPEVPPKGARVKVCYAGACYTDRQVKNSGKRRISCPGIKDTSLFTGFEVSGIIDGLGEQVENNNWQLGDRVVVYPDSTECFMEDGYDEYITVNNLENLVHIPNNLSLQLASLLPTGGLKAHSAVTRVRPFIIEKLNNRTDVINMVIVGAGGLGLWTVRLAKHLITSDPSRVHITVADPSVEKLMVAKEHGCHGVVHWHEPLYEQHILERTRDVCIGGVDVIIDFVSTPRTIKRSLKLLNDEGVLLVGGNSKYEFTFNLAIMAQKEQCMLGVNRGSRKQLQELVHIMAAGQVQPPCYSIFPVEEANTVFEKLTHCKITGRAVLEVCPETESTCSDRESSVDSDSVFS